MNHRCYRCGWSFSLGREAVEMAVAQAGKEKVYALPCPRCRQINKIPIKQLRNNLPAGWTPPAAEGTEVKPESPTVDAVPQNVAAIDDKAADDDKPPVKKTSSTKRAATNKKTSK